MYRNWKTSIKQGYYYRMVEPLTDLRQQKKTAEAMGNYTTARILQQQIETIERNLDTEREIKLEDRWAWTAQGKKERESKMDTQGM